MGRFTNLIDKIFGRETEALEEQQTDNEARIGMLQREFAEHPSKGLTPAKLYRILEDAEQGDLKAQHELFEDMEEKDPQIAADLGKRRQMAAELEWQIIPPDDANALEKKATEFCIEVFRSIDVEELIIDLGSGIGHGWVNLELEWKQQQKMHTIGQPIMRPHSWFQLNQDNQNELRLRANSVNGDELWPLGWVQHRHKAKAGYVARSGLHRVLVWPYLFQNYALGDLAQLLDIYGLPAKIGTYPRNATEAEKRTLLRAVQQLGHNAAGIVPEGMAIEFKEAANGKADLFETMMNWCERAKAKAILGGTLTSGTGEGTNTNALGNVHERSMMSLIGSDVRQYASTINRDILFPLVMLNFGIDNPSRAPRFYLDTGECEDFKLLAESLPKFVDMGMQIPTWWVHEKTRIPKPSEKDEILQAAVPPIAPLKNQHSHTAALRAELPENDNPDLLAQRLEKEAADPLRQWIQDIEAIAKNADNLEQLRDQLLNAYADLDEELLREVMELGFTAAAGAGAETVIEEVEDAT